MIRKTTTLLFNGRRNHYLVSKATDGWYVSLGHPSPYGHNYDPPLIRGLATKKQALEAKKRIIAGETP